jgi:hypothetical protein
MKVRFDRHPIACAWLLAAACTGTNHSVLQSSDVPDSGLPTGSDSGTGGGHIDELTDANFSWINSIWGSGDGDVYMASYYHVPLLHLTDVSPTGWQAVAIPGSPYLDAVWGTAANDVYAAGDGVWHSTDGQNWTQIYPAAANEVLYGMWGSSSSDFVVVGATGPGPTMAEVLHTTDGGHTFTKRTVPALSSLSGVWGSSSQDLYAVGWTPNTGQVYVAAVIHSTDGGQTWNFVLQQTSASLVSDRQQITGTSAHNVYVAMQNGLFHSTDQGLSWDNLQPSETLGAWTVGNDVFTGSFADPARHSADNLTWSELLPAGYHAYTIWGTSSDDLFIGGAKDNNDPADGDPATIMHLHGS